MTTDERLEKVEGQLTHMKLLNRYLTACIVLALGVLFILKTFGPETTWAKSAVKEIRAKRFVLEDENGMSMAVLTMFKYGPRLTLDGANGKPSAMFSVGKDGSVLTLADANSNPRAILSVGQDGPRLTLADANGKSRATFSVEKDGSMLSCTDENGKVIWSAP